MNVITDKTGSFYTVRRKAFDGGAIYYVHDGAERVARARLLAGKGCISELGVHRDYQRRGIASALYVLIESELGHPLRPFRIRSKAGRAFWTARVNPGRNCQ